MLAFELKISNGSARKLDLPAAKAGRRQHRSIGTGAAWRQEPNSPGAALPPFWDIELFLYCVTHGRTPAPLQRTPVLYVFSDNNWKLVAGPRFASFRRPRQHWRAMLPFEPDSATAAVAPAG